MPRRYVILHHTGFGREHWDLMLESDQVLWTWQLSRDPTTAGGEDIDAIRIGDHRKQYLTCEGPVSGDRGEVRRVDHGQIVTLTFGEGDITAELTGRHLSGRYRLRRIGDDMWRFGSAS